MSERKEKLIRRQARRIAELESQVRYLTSPRYCEQPPGSPDFGRGSRPF